MNIFVTTSNPIECALVLDDKRLVKMVLETAQLLATAIRFHGGNATYKATHLNHPCSVWVRSSASNYAWTLSHFEALSNEYTRRFNKKHKCFDYFNEFSSGLDLMPKGELQKFVNCTPFKELSVFEAYKQCLVSKWNNDVSPRWTNGDEPYFFKKVLKFSEERSISK